MDDEALEGFADDDEELMGYHSQKELRLYLESGLTDLIEQETLLHEVLHAAFAVAGIVLPDEEAWVSALSPTLFGVLRNNPELLKYLRA